MFFVSALVPFQPRTKLLGTLTPSACTLKLP